MFGYKRVVIAQHERGLLFRDRSFIEIMGPGVYRYYDLLGRIGIERHDLSKPEFAHELVDFMLKERADLCAKHFQVIELGERQVGLVYKNDKLAGILPPATRQLYWQGPVKVHVDTVDIAEDFRIPERLAVLLTRARPNTAPQGIGNMIYAVEVGDHQVGLLRVNGELKETLAPGSYAFWAFQRSIAVELIDKRVQTLEVSGQEILSKDRVSLRLNLSASYLVKDPVQARTSVADYKDFLYRELQFGLRQAVGTRSLDELLANKGQLDKVIFEHAAAKVSEHGLELRSVGVKDVILPGDMKDILNQVVEAEKVAQANNIRRREETAATRSLLNTAKLMDDNPTLLRLKELETLEKVTGKIERLTVFGGLEGVLQELVTIKSP